MIYLIVFQSVVHTPFFNFHISSRKALQLARKHADAFFFVVFLIQNRYAVNNPVDTLDYKQSHIEA